MNRRRYTLLPLVLGDTVWCFCWILLPVAWLACLLQPDLMFLVSTGLTSDASGVVVAWMWKYH
jgi:hypothetical protein